MTTIRQDAWNHDEDLLLAETVLRHIREGSTQLSAFEEVGRKLSRTSAACGFRWNSLVRKQYESAITVAKKQRKQLKLKLKNGEGYRQDELTDGMSSKQSVVIDHGDVGKQSADKLTLEKIIHYLSQLNGREKIYLMLEKENSNLRKQIEMEKHTQYELNQQLEKLHNEYQLMQDDYKAMMAIMERARKMVVYDETESSIRIQMATNGSAKK